MWTSPTRLGVLAALLTALLSTSPAEAEICRFLTSGDWGPIDVLAAGATVDCEGGAPTSDDALVIPAGISVRVIDDLLFDAVGDESSILVEDGGSLEVSALSAAGPLTLRVNQPINSNRGGIRCETGATCGLEGGYREFGSATPMLRGSLEEAGFGVVGDVLPCPGWSDATSNWQSDCGASLVGGGDLPGSRAEMGFLYRPEEFGAGDDFEMLAALGVIEPGDLLCFGDPDVTTPEAPVDDGFCYEVVRVDPDTEGSGQGIVVVDVRQTDPQNPKETSYPLAIREIAFGTTNRPVEAGDRWIEVGSDFIDCTAACRDTSPKGALDGRADRERVGMWLRFPDVDGSPLPTSQRISRSYDDPGDDESPRHCASGAGQCDLFEIFDPAGFAGPHAAGSPFWIDYGHTPGETFFVLAPVKITGSETPAGEGPILKVQRGTQLSFRSVLIDDTGRVELDLDDVVAEDLVFRDVTAGETGNGSAFALRAPVTVTLRRVSLTGGNVPGMDQIHSITIGGQTTPALGWLHTIKARHVGDDLLSGNGSVDWQQLERLESWWMTPDASSCQLIEHGPGSAYTGRCVDCGCIDCASNDASPSSGTISGISGSSVFTYEGFSRWGTPGAFRSGVASGVDVIDYFSVGGDHEIPHRVDGFVVALVDDAGDATGGVNGLIGEPHTAVRNGIVRDYTRAAGAVMRTPDLGTLTNLAFIDVDSRADCTDTLCAAVQVLAKPADGDAVASRLTVVTREGSTSRLDSAFRLRDNDNRHAFDGLLVSGLSSSTEEGIAIEGNLNRLEDFLSTNTGDGSPGDELTHGPCLDDNKLNVSPGSEAGLPASTVENVAPGFVDPSNDRFDTAPGSSADLAGCGVQGGAAAPGIKRYRYMHAVSATLPEVMAQDDDGDGFPTAAADTPCWAGQTRHCADNCAADFNPDQADEDGDGQGDLCDQTFELPDLDIDGLDVPETIDLGEPTDLAAGLRAAGPGSPGPVEVEVTFFYSTDDVTDPMTDTPLATCVRPHPFPGTTVECEVFDALLSAPEGPAFVGACADTQDAVAESDEDNNCSPGVAVTFVPEPAIAALQLAGLLGLAGLARGRRARA